MSDCRLTMKSSLPAGSPNLGVDQHCRRIDELASQAIGTKRHGVAVGSVNQKRELVSKPMRIARAESASECAQATAHFSLVGAGNGLAVTKLRMPAFIVTLTTMMLFSGLAIWLWLARASSAASAPIAAATS